VVVDTACGNRIVIIGSSNSGKSTLARQIGVQLGVPVIELDAFHWEPNWTPADPDVFRERIRHAMQPECWVMAGNYTQHQDITWAAADTIVWLDLPLPLVVRRCVVRTWTRWRTKEVLWGNNREDFREHLQFWNTDRSLIAYTIANHRRRKRAYAAAITDPRWSHITFIRLRSPAEVDSWFQQATGQPSSLAVVDTDETSPVAR
jgi:adenylate kinase family enzyme